MKTGLEWPLSVAVGKTRILRRLALIVPLMAAGVLGAGCASTDCGGVGFDSSANINFGALHRQHPGLLTVHLCVDGACHSSAQLQPSDDNWIASAEPTTTKRHITIQITDATGTQIFSGSTVSDATKVVFNPGQCDEQTGHNSAVVAGRDGKLSNVPVTPTVVTFDPGVNPTG